jgi:hypothetical protein
MYGVVVTLHVPTSGDGTRDLSYSNSPAMAGPVIAARVITIASESARFKVAD